MALTRILALLFFLGLPAAASSVEDEAAQTVDYFYNLQFDQAFAAARGIEAKHPDHPAGPFYLGVAYFQRYLIELPARPETLHSFEDAMARTLAAAERMKSDQPDLYHYYAGAAIGFQSRALVAHGRYAAAIPRARQGLTHLQKALHLNPQLEDAYMGLGMYYYFTDRVPGPVKPFSYLMVGMWGDREKGLRLLHRTAEHGTAARMEALSILAAIYSSEMERHWPEAESLFRRLMDRYPLNPRYRLGLAYVLERQGDWAGAEALCDPNGAWVAALDPLVRPTAEAAARCRLAELLLFQGRWAEAGKALDRLENEKAPAALADWIRLRRANWLDAMNRREEAKALYKQIQMKKPKRLALQFMDHPFPAGSRDAMPKFWPLPVVPE